MPKYLLAYHGGGMPATPEEGERVMKAWNDWYGTLGPAIADGGPLPNCWCSTMKSAS